MQRIQDIEAQVDLENVTPEQVDASLTRCPDPEASARMVERIDAVREAQDSVGGIVSCVVRKLPAGLGEPIFNKLDADLAAAMLSLPAVKGFEVGSGFDGVALRGSEHNDAFVPGPDGQPHTTTNRSGGVQGGISNGEPLFFRVAFKPTATVGVAQTTVDNKGQAVTLEARGRHDPCVLPRAVPIVEAMANLVLADHWLRQRGVDVLPKL